VSRRLALLYPFLYQTVVKRCAANENGCHTQISGTMGSPVPNKVRAHGLCVSMAIIVRHLVERGDAI